MKRNLYSSRYAGNQVLVAITQKDTTTTTKATAPTHPLPELPDDVLQIIWSHVKLDVWDRAQERNRALQEFYEHKCYNHGKAPCEINEIIRWYQEYKEQAEIEREWEESWTFEDWVEYQSQLREMAAR